MITMKEYIYDIGRKCLQVSLACFKFPSFDVNRKGNYKIKIIINISTNYNDYLCE